MSRRAIAEASWLPAGEGLVPHRRPRSHRDELAKERQALADEVSRPDEVDDRDHHAEPEDRAGTRQSSATTTSASTTAEVIELVEPLVVAEGPAEARCQLRAVLVVDLVLCLASGDVEPLVEHHHEELASPRGPALLE